jgi:hypothetical protein
MLAAAACAERHRTPPPRAAPRVAVIPVEAAPTPEPIPAPEPVDPRVAALLDSGELIVGSRIGLEAWQPDGASHRVISPGAALHPRRFGRDHVLALRGLTGNDLRDGALLELISLADGQRRELAQLPAFRCAEQRDPTQPKPHRLNVEDPSDFEVDSRQRVACLGLMDAPSNKASVRVRARLDLTAAHVDRWLVLGEGDCTPPEGVEAGDPAADGVCWGIARVAQPDPDPNGYPFTFDEEHVRMPAAPRGGSKLQLRGYSIELTSPSRRWLLLTGDYTEREATYRRLLLLDRNLGKLFPIVDRAGGWPVPLTPSGSKFKTPIKQAQLLASATDLRWLGSSEQSEVLVLGGLVVRPGLPAFEIIEGEFAR